MTTRRRSAESAIPLGVGDVLTGTLLTTLLALRPLIADAFQRTEVGFLMAATGQPVASAGPTMLLDLVTLIAAGWLLVRFARGAGWAWFGGGVALLTAAVIASTVFAAAQRVALNAGASFIVSVLAVGGLTALLRAAPGWRRLVVSMALAGAAATAAACFTQTWINAAATQEEWRLQKEQLVRSGYDPNDPLLMNFERRLLAGEASGFLGHPNVTASVLNMWTLLALGVMSAAVARWRRAAPDDPQRQRLAALAVLMLVVIAVCQTALSLTGSLGGYVALLAGLAAFAAIGLAPRPLLRRPAWVLALGVGAYVLLVAAGWTYGWLNDGYPVKTLQFRWYYWSAAAQGAAEAPWTGVGRENFDAVYLQHRPPESAEAVKSPHNLWVTAWVELGVFGLIAVLALALLGVSLAVRGVCCPSRGSPDDEHHGALRLTADTHPPLVVMVGAPLLLLLLQLLQSDVFRHGVDTVPALGLLWIVEFASPFLAVFVMTWLLTRQVIESADARWLAIGALAAVGAALTHSLVGFALSTTGGLAVIAAAVALSGRSQLLTPRAGRDATPFVIVLALAAVMHVWFVVAPTVRSESASRAADERLVRITSPQALRDWMAASEAAIDADALDAGPARYFAARLLAFVNDPSAPRDVQTDLLGAAEGAIATALRREPDASATLRLAGRAAQARARLALARPDLAAADAALAKAARDWSAAARRSPTDVRLRIEAGAAQHQLWSETNDTSAVTPAREHLTAALVINEAREPQDATRLSDRELSRIRALLADLPESE